MEYTKENKATPMSSHAKTEEATPNMGLHSTNHSVTAPHAGAHHGVYADGKFPEHPQAEHTAAPGHDKHPHLPAHHDINKY